MRYNEGKADELREKFWKALADSPYLFLQLDTDPKSAVPTSSGSGLRRTVRAGRSPTVSAVANSRS